MFYSFLYIFTGSKQNNSGVSLIEICELGTHMYKHEFSLTSSSLLSRKCLCEVISSSSRSKSLTSSEQTVVTFYLAHSNFASLVLHNWMHRNMNTHTKFIVITVHRIPFRQKLKPCPRSKTRSIKKKVRKKERT